MPYKVVQTIENGKICLSVVPNSWEKEGTLSWPPRSEASNMLDENSVPGNNWSTYPCIVKRNCKTYKAARLELKEMGNLTETEEEVPLNVSQSVPEENDVVFDLNHLMQDGEGSTAIVTPITVTASNNIMADRISLNDVNTSFLLKNDYDEVIKNQAKILEILQDVQNTQKIILQQLSKQEVQYNELCNKMADRVITGTNPVGFIDERFQPLKTVEELHQLENNLKNPDFQKKYFQIMSRLCSPGLGAKGINVCYKIVDFFFTRELLTLVSWSGNSRDQSEKVAFKFFSLIRQMFFSVIHSADPTTSQLETDNFIKTIIKNSRQRFLATLKPVSVSTPKNRKKRSNNAKSQIEVPDSNIEPTADVEVQEPIVNVDEQNHD